MKKILLFIIISILWYASTLATSITIPSGVMNIYPGLTGNYSILNFTGQNNFNGLFLWLNNKTGVSVSITLSGETITCTEQLRGLYYSNQRGNFLRPLDNDTRLALSGVITNYQSMTITGGLYSSCSSKGSGQIFGSVGNTIGGHTYWLVGGVTFDIANNSRSSPFADTFYKYSDTASGYIFDSQGGVGRIISGALSEVIIQDPILGCTDSTAINYNSSATQNDGSCIYPGVVSPFLLDWIFEATPGNYYTSNVITITGLSIGQTGSASITAGTLYKNGTSVGSSTTVSSGDQLYIRLQASSLYNSNVSSVLTVGDKSSTFFVRTHARYPFFFLPVHNANLSTQYTSDTITVSQLPGSGPRAVSITSGPGTLYKNGTSVGSSTTVVNGDKLYIVMTSSSSYDTTVSTTLNIVNKGSATFTIITKSQAGTGATGPQGPAGVGGYSDFSCNSLTNSQRLQLHVIMQTVGNANNGNTSFFQTLKSAINSMLYTYTNLSNLERSALTCFSTMIDSYIGSVGGINTYDEAIYTAPNGKTYRITYDSVRVAYTSPDFVLPAYFTSFAGLQLYIDRQNPGVGQGYLSRGALPTMGNHSRGADVQVTPNGKVYRILQNSSGRRYSPDTRTIREFSTQSELRDFLVRNNQ